MSIAIKVSKFPRSLLAAIVQPYILQYILENCCGGKNNEHQNWYVLSEKHDILETIFQTTNGYRLYEK